MDTNKISMADAMDRKMQIFAFVVFLIALKYGVSATASLMGEDWAMYFKIAEIALTLPAVLFVLGILFWKFGKLTREQRKELLNPEGYVFDTFRNACMKSWVWTVVFLTFSAPFARRLGSDVPHEFFIECSVFFMLGVFSVVFFYLNRFGGDHEIKEASNR